jgi:hypothetical protein
MHTNLKLEHVRRIMDKMHERQRRQAEDLSRLCALLTDLATEHGEACGADQEVVAAVIAPKDDPKP